MNKDALISAKGNFGCYICYICYMLVSKALEAYNSATFCYKALQTDYKEGGFATFIYIMIDMLQYLSLYIASFSMSCRNVSAVAPVMPEKVSRTRVRISVIIHPRKDSIHTFYINS